MWSAINVLIKCFFIKFILELMRIIVTHGILDNSSQLTHFCGHHFESIASLHHCEYCQMNELSCNRNVGNNGMSNFKEYDEITHNLYDSFDQNSHIELLHVLFAMFMKLLTEFWSFSQQSNNSPDVPPCLFVSFLHHDRVYLIN